MNPNLPPHSHGGAAPVPRDHDRASLTEIMPFGSRKIRMARSPLTILLLIAGLATPPLFAILQYMGQHYRSDQSLINTFILTSIIAIFLMTLAYCFLVYFYARPGRSAWPFLFAYIFLNVVAIGPQIAGFPFIWEGFNWLFRTAFGMTVDDLQRPGQSFLPLFGKMYVAAGLCEELFKALPILFGAILALAYARRPDPKPALVRFFQIRGPLDGALMGVFVGAAFVFYETALDYVPSNAMDIYAETGKASLGVQYGFMLLFPRVIGGIVGHSAYSAIFGYFIGLGVLRRRQFLPLVIGGWLIAALVHGLWNSVDTISPYLYYAVEIVCAIFAAAAILKGRQLNQALYGEPPETFGSIVVDRSGAAAGQALPAFAPPVVPPPMPSFPPAHPVARRDGGYPSQPLQPTRPPQQEPAPQGGYPAAPLQAPPLPPSPAAPEAPSPAPAATSPSWPQPDSDPQVHGPTETVAAGTDPAGSEQPLQLEIAGLAIPLRPGIAIDLGAEPALAGRGQGVRGEVVPHPSRPGVLGLRNGSDGEWTAQLRDGRTQQIGRDQNVRLAAGVSLDFGGGLTGNVGPRE
jgi:RsiW-degrading membrane proteinase PrsW (M82 family)